MVKNFQQFSYLGDSSSVVTVNCCPPKRQLLKIPKNIAQAQKKKKAKISSERKRTTAHQQGDAVDGHGASDLPMSSHQAVHHPHATQRPRAEVRDVRCRHHARCALRPQQFCPAALSLEASAAVWEATSRSPPAVAARLPLVAGCPAPQLRLPFPSSSDRALSTVELKAASFPPQTLALLESHGLSAGRLCTLICSGVALIAGFYGRVLDPQRDRPAYSRERKVPIHPAALRVRLVER